MRSSAWLFFGLGSVCVPGCFTDPIDTAATGVGSTTAAQDSTGAFTSEAAPQSSSSTDPTLDPASSSGADTTSSTSEADDASSDATSSSGGSSSTGGGSSSTGAVAFCGDGVLDPEESCDGAALGGISCDTFGFVGGTLTCADDCTFVVQACTPPDGMAFIPPGTFEMGSIDAAEEQPIRNVTLSGYFIDVTEVTAGAYAECVDEAFCVPPMSTANQQFDAQCNYGRDDRLDHPVNCAGFDQSAAYCNWLGKRLPTEAEWERAARWTDARRYPWGNAPGPSCLNAVMDDGGLGCGEGSTFAVMSKPAGVSEEGLHDMIGNVWEWVSDYYGEYDAAQTLDPTGPGFGTDRILRGGGWFQDEPADFTVTHRHEVPPNLSDAFIGFRCVMELQAP